MKQFCRLWFGGLMFATLGLAIADQTMQAEGSTPSHATINYPGSQTAQVLKSKASTPQPNTHKGVVARAMFTTNVINREPIDKLGFINSQAKRITYFTDLRNLAGQTVTHRWEYNNQVMAEVKFHINGPRWRVHSQKNIIPQWTGDWSVIVTDSTGYPLKISMIAVVNKSVLAGIKNTQVNQIGRE